jgi:hypothetical protein
MEAGRQRPLWMNPPVQTRKENQPDGKVQKQKRFPLSHRHDYEKERHVA